MDQVLTAFNCLHCGSTTQGDAYCCVACERLHNQFETKKLEIDPELLFLDQANFRELYLDRNSEYQYQLYVEGLHCSSCVHLLEKIPEFDPSVLEARVEFARSRLALKVNEAFSLAQLMTLLKSWGYTPSFLKPEESSDEALLKENRSALKRIGVAGACAGNIMLFVIPVYAGLAGHWQNIFNWMSFFLFLPILFYSALPFYKGAWNSLRYQTVNVDLPISLALWSGFLLSTVNMIRGNGHIYYDSTASFIFLILCARYLLKRVQQNFLSSYNLRDFIQTDKFRLQTENEESLISLNEIRPGDILLLEKGQSCPIDGTLLSEEALIDLSILNGESFPRRFHHKMEILAGSKILSPYIKIQVLKQARESRLALLLKDLEQGSWHKSDFVSLTDRLAQRLIITVFATAALFFIFYFNIDVQEAFNRSLALIVLACPCALAFGSPLALGLSLKKAREQGILIKDSNSLEKILQVKNIFFDKTGTLTEADLKLTSTEPLALDLETKTILISLEQSSYHPVAFALRKTWPEIHSQPVTNLKETLGEGVSGWMNSHFYELKALNESLHEEALALVLLKDGQACARLYFEDPLRADAVACLNEIKTSKTQYFLLSGDSRERVLNVAQACGIEKEQAFYELFPEDKKEIILQHKNTCMIGDGANDALSFMAADVAIAMKGSANLSLHAADIYFTHGGLRPFLKLIHLAHQARRVLVRNLSLSLIYNLVGGVLALGGFINPLLAAILMPLSSIIIILSTWWGLR